MNLSTWCLIIIYIGYWSVVNSLQWDVESILEFDYEGASTPMGSSSPQSKLLFLDGTVYEGWMGFQFTFVHKDILVIMLGCTGISEWHIQIELID